MKKIIRILSLTLTFIMLFGIIGASAKGNVIANDIFYAEIPENFEICNDYGDDHYYLENTADFSGKIEIYVEGNIIFPDGIKNTEKNIIIERIDNFLYREESIRLNVDDVKKGNINGISACYVSGMVTDSLSEEFFHIYVLTTKENLILIKTSGSDLSLEEEPDYFKEFIRSFLVNGTYYDGEKLSKAYDFSKAEHYIDILERDVLTDDFYTYNSGVDFFAGIVIIGTLALPILTITFFVLYIKARKKLKEYKKFFGSIEQARAGMSRGYYQSNGYGYNQTVNQPYQPPVNPNYQPNPYGQNLNPQQFAPQGTPYGQNPVNPNYQTNPYGQTPVNQEASVTPSYVTNAINNLEEASQQPVQNNLPPELQDSVKEENQ